MKRFLIVLFLCAAFSAYSQTTLNNYRYVVVPQKFSFLKEADQYSLNSLAKALFEDKGFVVYFDNTELPADLSANRCLALYMDITEKGSMFSTGITISMKDCMGNIVFKTKEGKSREKDYQTAYHMALRDAFTSFDQAKYIYVGPANTVAPPPAAAPVTVIKPVAETTAATVKPTTSVSNQPATTLYAQAIANGYQLIDTTPKIVLTLMKTSVENYFIAGNATANGIVMKKDGGWFFEYYKDGQLISEKLLVKF